MTDSSFESLAHQIADRLNRKTLSIEVLFTPLNALGLDLLEIHLLFEALFERFGQFEDTYIGVVDEYEITIAELIHICLAQLERHEPFTGPGA